MIDSPTQTCWSQIAQTLIRYVMMATDDFLLAYAEPLTQKNSATVVTPLAEATITTTTSSTND